VTRGRAGFTLIELLIAVAIVGLLAAVALPGYNEHVAKSRRAQGQTALLKAIQLQERFYTANSRYANNAEFATLFGLAGGAAVYSGENPADATTGRYILAVVPQGTCTDLNTCVNVRAIPLVADPKCGVLMLDSRGTRLEFGTQTVQYCWKN